MGMVSLIGMLLAVFQLYLRPKVMWKMALNSGSSKHGNALRAYTVSN